MFQIKFRRKLSTISKNWLFNQSSKSVLLKVAFITVKMTPPIFSLYYNCLPFPTHIQPRDCRSPSSYWNNVKKRQKLVEYWFHDCPQHDGTKYMSNSSKWPFAKDSLSKTPYLDSKIQFAMMPFRQHRILT